MLLQYQFPLYGESDAKRKLDELRRLTQPDLFQTRYLDARSAARLLVAGLEAYRDGFHSKLWEDNDQLAALRQSPQRINFVFAALFDLVCNAGYIHNRIVSANWIYCNRHRQEQTPQPTAYYSFLKQCPKCCIDRGLEPRLSGDAQHKPSSHYIGEITTTITAFLLQVLTFAIPKPLAIAVISLQSHDVDAVAYRDDMLVLMEIKSSPMVTFPLRAQLNSAMTRENNGVIEEYPQHSLVTIDYSLYSLDLFLPHIDLAIPLGAVTPPTWPYPTLESWIRLPENFLLFLASWLEIFNAYSIPKTERRGRAVALGYLANGWGDEIDSNKTKPGLGRTDDIKKGTYQLLKFGAYYRTGTSDLTIRSALVSNLDPLFLYADYMEKLLDIRWAKERFFFDLSEKPGYKGIRDTDLYFLYEAVLAFNRPVINETLLSQYFNFPLVEQNLFQGKLNPLLEFWKASR